MKLMFAASSEDLNSDLNPRFGRCPIFLMVDTENDSVQAFPNTQNLNAAQGAGIQAATNVADAGAQAVFCGHCGPKAFRVLQAAGIDVYAGVSGKICDLIAKYKAGEIKPLDSADVEGHWM